MQAQIFPYSYQNAILRGNATKIDALMMRAYLADHHSIPAGGEAKAFAGGYTEMRRCGVARNVFHCDVTSLYPSLMLEFGHAPASDALGVFLKMLSDLRSFRIKAKALARELTGGARRNRTLTGTVPSPRRTVKEMSRTASMAVPANWNDLLRPLTSIRRASDD